MSNIIKGTILVLKPKTRTFAAKVGARCRVTNYPSVHGGEETVDVEWIDEKGKGQNDGDYSLGDFEVETPPLDVVKATTHLTDAIVAITIAIDQIQRGHGPIAQERMIKSAYYGLDVALQLVRDTMPDGEQLAA